MLTHDLSMEQWRERAQAGAKQEMQLGKDTFTHSLTHIKTGRKSMKWNGAEGMFTHSLTYIKTGRKSILSRNIVSVLLQPKQHLIFPFPKLLNQGGS